MEGAHGNAVMNIKVISPRNVIVIQDVGWKKKVDKESEWCFFEVVADRVGWIGRGLQRKKKLGGGGGLGNLTPGLLYNNQKGNFIETEFYILGKIDLFEIDLDLILGKCIRP